MAHQAHNIPWNLLSSCLDWKWNNSCPCGSPYSHLHLNVKKREELLRFAGAFARNIDEHSTCERKKYREEFEPLDPDDVVLDDTVVRRISPTVRRWREYNEDKLSIESHPCPLGNAEECQCPAIPDQDRKASAFQKGGHNLFRPSKEYFGESEPGFFNIEIFKTLILYGEMDLVLRLCADPRAIMRKWWSRRHTFTIFTDVFHLCHLDVPHLVLTSLD